MKENACDSVTSHVMQFLCWLGDGFTQMGTKEGHNLEGKQIIAVLEFQFMRINVEYEISDQDT